MRTSPSVPALVIAALSLVLTAGCRRGAEYERAAKALQPTFDALTALRAETLLDPDIPAGGALGETIHLQVDRCSGLGEKVAKLDADPALYSEPSLVSMVTAVRRDLRDTSAVDACKAAVIDEANPLATLSRWKKCVDTCRTWFTNVERDAAIFSSNARSAGIDSKGIPPDDRFSR